MKFYGWVNLKIILKMKKKIYNLNIGRENYGLSKLKAETVVREQFKFQFKFETLSL